MYSHSGELRQRRSEAPPAPASASLTLTDIVLDKAETVATKGMQLCHSISFILMFALIVSFMGEGLYLLFSHPELEEVRPGYFSVDLTDYPFKENSVALVLHNSSLPHHAEFLKDARKANAKHKVRLATIDCNEYKEPCENIYHADGGEDNVALPDKSFDFNGEEPELLYVEAGTLTDSYHVSLKDGSVSQLSDRVAKLLMWLDVAAARAPSRASEREKKRQARLEQYNDGMNDPTSPYGPGAYNHPGRRGYPGMGMHGMPGGPSGAGWDMPDYSDYIPAGQPTA